MIDELYNKEKKYVKYHSLQQYMQEHHQIEYKGTKRIAIRVETEKARVVLKGNMRLEMRLKAITVCIIAIIYLNSEPVI